MPVLGLIVKFDSSNPTDELSRAGLDKSSPCNKMTILTILPGTQKFKKKIRILKNQKPVEYMGILRYIIGMINTTFFPVRFDVAETGGPH
jgi:hypothetical protein